MRGKGRKGNMEEENRRRIGRTMKDRRTDGREQEPEENRKEGDLE
jgi:hypothetical protein